MSKLPKEKRCNLYDDEGRARLHRDGTKGCPRRASGCNFAHPGEPEWRVAKSSIPPRRDLVLDDDSQFYYVLLGHRRRGSYDESTHHRDHSPTSRSARRPVDVDMSSSRRRSRSPVRKVAPHSYKPESADRKGYTPPGSPRRTRATEDTRRSIPDAARRSSPGRTQSMTRKPSVPTSSRTSVPPEPAHPFPVQPPPPAVPPLPTAPAFLSQQPYSRDGFSALQGMRGLSLDEQRKVWHERVDLMFTSITTRRDYAKIESDLESFRRLSQSSYVAGLPEEEQSRINEQKIALEHQLEKKRKEVSEVIQHLIETEFWPTLKAPELQGLEKTLVEVKKHVSDVKSSLEDLQSSCSALFGSQAIPPGQNPEQSDVAEPPKKRRRLSEGEVAEDDGSGGVSYQPIELEGFRDKLAGLSRQVSDLENHIHQRHQIMHDEMELRIDERLADEGYLSAVEEIRVPQADIEVVVDAHNSTLVQNIQTTGSEVGQLAEEVATLIGQRHELEQKCTRIETENESLKGAIAELTAKCDSPNPAIISKEVEALNAALQAYISQVPPIEKRLPVDYIMELLDNEIVSLVREQFTPLLVSIRQELVDKAKDNHQRTPFPKSRTTDANGLSGQS
ncbi:hypothetical protein EDD16DRAFT_1616131 [Pisolithus croceorrhizus]|nr:hypothetical protein EDD16DRAFT_1616131 [Pisolithus croceorrhizus]